MPGILTKIRKAASSCAVGIKRIPGQGEKDTNQIEDVIKGDTATDAEKSIADIDPLLAYKVSAYYYACVHAITMNLVKVPMIVRDCKTKEQIKDDEFLNDFLRAPGKMQGKPIYWSRYMTRWLINRYVFGASYFQYLLGEQQNRYVGVHALKRPDNMLEVKDDDTGEILGYELTIGEWTKSYSLDEVTELKIESPDSDTDVHSPIESLATTMSLYIQASKYNQGVFKNGPRPGGVIKFDNPLRDKQYKRLNYFLTNMANYPGRWLILDAPGAKLETGGQLADANVAEVAYRGLSEDLRDEIMAVTGVTPIMIGMSKEMTYHNASLQLKRFWTGQGESLLDEQCHFLTVDVLPKMGIDPGREIWYDEEYVKKQYQDPQLVGKQLNDAVDRGAMTRNQMRIALGMKREEDIPEMDMYFVNSQLVPISTIEASPMSEVDVESDEVEMEEAQSSTGSEQKRVAGEQDTKETTEEPVKQEVE